MNKHPAVPSSVPTQHISIPSSSLSTLVLCFVALVITATSSHSCRLVNEILLTIGSSLWFGFFLYKSNEREAHAKKEFCHHLLNH